MNEITKVDDWDVLRLVRLVRGGRFLAEAKTFPALFSEEEDIAVDAEGCRFAFDDVVEEENDERRLLLDISEFC